MELTKKKIFDLLPKTDCRKCGQATCGNFAAQLSLRQGSLSACPDISAEARMLIAQVLEAERDMMASLKSITAADVKRALGGVLMLPVKGLSLFIVAFPFLALAWLLIVWLFMK